MTPKLCVLTRLDDFNVILTGIRPQSEIKKMNAWSGGVILLKKYEGCKTNINVADENLDAPESLAERRTLQHLNKTEVLLDADFAARQGLKECDRLQLPGKRLTCSACFL